MSTSPERRRRWPWVLLGLFALLVIGGWVAFQRLDAFLLQRARDEARELSARLDRPVTIGALSTRLFPRLGATIEQVEVGPGPGEERHLAQLASLEVDVQTWPLLTSRGKDVRVERAEARGLTLQVVRYPDGTTNLSRTLERLEETAPPEPPADEAPPADLSGVKVARAALVDGVIRLIDARGAQPTTLEITALNVEVKDLQVGQPLEVALSAAVLAKEKNLEASLGAAPLPKDLRPTPRTFTLKLAPVDVSPLAPFLVGTGLQGGTVQADLHADLGAAVPGGEGATRIRGGLQAKELRFEGAKALDVNVEADLVADVPRGDLQLNKLLATAGPARLEGSGRVQGLLSEGELAVEDFRLVGRGLDFQALSSYYPPLRQSLGDMLAGPLGFTVEGRGSAEAQVLTASVELTPVRLRIPEQLTKAAGAPMRMSGSVSGAAAGGGPVRFQVSLLADGADLRPGELLDKAPGERLRVEAAGTFKPGSKGEETVVEVSRLRAAIKKDTLEGTARFVPGEKTTTFQLDLRAPRIDADALLMSDEEVVAHAGKPPAPDAAKDPRRFEGYRGDIRLEAKAIRYKAIELEQVRAHLEMLDDKVEVKRFDVRVFGGEVSAGGSAVRLGPPASERPFTGKVKLSGIAVERALATRTDKKILTGRFSGDVDVGGVGYEMEALEQSLAGALQGELENGTFFGLDVVDAVARPLAQALPFARKVAKVGDVMELAEHLPFGVTFESGVAQLKKPITWTRPDEAQLWFDGGIRLDGTLALDGRVHLAPPLIHGLTGGRVRPPEPIPLELKLTGPAWKPRVEGLDVRPAAQALIKLAAGGAAQKLLGKERAEQLEKVVGSDVEETKEKARREAERRAEEEKRRLEEEARRRAEAEKKRLEEEAKKKLRGLFGR